MDAPFPGALFAMDGTLCMLTTKGKHNEYVGRKSLPQMNVLVVCDWNMNLVHIDSNFTGRTQDNTMYMSSALHFAIDGENSLLHPGGFIIADEGFACREHILRPYGKRTDDLEKILFNFVFKSTRLLVENAIGAWKQKCPLLNIGMHKMEPVVMSILKNSMIIRIAISSDELVWHNHQRKSRVLAIWPVPTDVTQSTYVIMHFAFPNGLIFREIDCLKYGRFRPFADSLCMDGV